MLTDIFFTMISAFLTLLHIILPNWSFPPIITTSIETLSQGLATINILFPVWHFITCIGLIILYHGTKMIAKLVTGIINLIRGSGGVDID